MSRRLDDSRIVNRVVPIDAIQPHPENPRLHPDVQLQGLGASHQEFGQYRSVVLWQRPGGKYIQVAGHGYVEAAKREGATEFRADILPEDTDPLTIKAIMAADNLHAQNSTDDDELLARLLDEQKNAGFDLASMGTDEEALRQLLQSLGDEYLGGEGSEEGDGGDDFDVTPEEGLTRTHVGELWQLGEHRLLVGDCTKVEDIQRLMAGKKIDLLWTDPPYNIDVAGGTHDPRSPNYRNGQRIKNDDKSPAEFYHFLCSAFKSVDGFMREGAVYYIAHPDIFAYEFVGSVRQVGWQQARPPVVLWIKDSIVFGRGDYHARSEPILYGWKPGAAHHQVEDRTQDNVWEIPRPKRSEDHPTMKPLELVERAINNSSDSGDIVFDGFLGSGTTLIAAQRTGRVCYGCELDPRYADVILARYEAETGQQATLLERVEEEVTHA